jgi:DNA (cytosine-5)-methyltransferase 1
MSGGAYRALDLFSGAGGATRGLQLAGFHVTGVDIRPQPRYCGDVFVQADALEFPLDGFDFVWASPPCQAHTAMSNRWRGKGGKADSHPDLIDPVRERLLGWGGSWVLENVVGAPLRPDATLTGGMFGLGVHRPRVFESSALLFSPPAVAPPAGALGIYGKHHDGRLLFRRADGTEQRAARTLTEARDAMGIDWMEWRELAESIPPAYSHYLGRQIVAALEAAA